MKKRENICKKAKVIILIFIISMVLFLIILIDLLTIKQITKLDYYIYEKIPKIQIPIITNIMVFITSIANTLQLIILTIILSAILMIKKKYSNIVLLLISMSIGLLSELLTKNVIQRLRPEFSLIEVTRFSFPSGHATMSIIFFAILFYSLINETKNKKSNIFLGIIISIIVLLIGFSRIYLGVHWFSDVFGGFLLGIFIISISLLIKNSLELKIKWIAKR
jgi:undecaprenyl-diphosphatase